MAQFSESDFIINPDYSVYHLNLRPQDIADDIIVVGDPNRVHQVSTFFDTIDFEMNRREFITHTGKYKGKRISVISSGIGTDNVEILLTELDALANIDLQKRSIKEKKKTLRFYRVGTSGSIQNDLRVGTHLITDYAIGLDSLMLYYEHALGEEESRLAQELQDTLQFSFPPYIFRGSQSLIEKFKDGMTIGNTVTCPGFYAPQGREMRLPIRTKNIIQQLQYFHINNTWLTNIEMETAGYYALGHLLGHEMVSLNAIVANRVKGSFSKNPNKIIDSLIKKVLDRI